MIRRTFIKSAGLGLVGCLSGVCAPGCAVTGRREITVSAFKYGESTLPESMAFRGGSKSRRVPISFLFYMIGIGDAKILVDVGCDHMPGFRMEHFIRPVDLLGRYGIRPDDIGDAVITHAHHDHIGAVGHFVNSRIWIQSREARKGAKYLRGLNVGTFENGMTLHGCVEVRRIGGHTAGSSIAVVPFADRSVVLAGDECYVRRCLDEKIPTGVSCDPAKSKAFVDTYSGDRYDVCLYHDISVLPGMNGMQTVI